MAQFRTTVWRDGNHMLFESGHKTFDRQVDCISTGNMIGDVQLSFYIRPKVETECNGFSFKPGHLRDFNLSMFKQLPVVVRQRVLSLTETNGVWLYEFRHWAGEQKIVHGYVITSSDHQLLAKFITGPTSKSAQVIDEAITYITRKEAGCNDGQVQ